MAPPDIKLRGLRSPIPPGYVLGRTAQGSGDVQLIPISAFDNKTRSSSDAALNSARAYADAGDAATLVSANAYTDAAVAAVSFPVTSVFGRSGAVVAVANDYSIGQIGGLGTGIATALGINTGSAGAPVLFNGAGGTPSSLTLTNATGLPNASVIGLGTAALKAVSNAAKTTVASVNTASTGFFARFADNNGTVENSGYSNADFDAAGAAAAVLATSLQKASNLSDVANAATARSNLGLVIGTNVQAYDATLASIAALGTAANKFAYTTGVDTWAEADLTAAGRAILDDADATAQRVTLGLVIGTNVQAYDADLTTWAAITPGTNVGTILAQTAVGTGVLPSETSGSGSISHAHLNGFTEVGGNATANYYWVKVGHMVVLTVTIQGVTSVAATNGTSYIAAAAFPAWTLASPSNFAAPPAVNNSTSVSVSGGGSFNGNFWMSTFSATANIMVQTVTFQTTN